jgi:hypothetical protein
VTYRCVPEGGRSRPRPASRTLDALDAVAGLGAGGPHAAVDVYGRPAGRPPWLAAGSEYLALLERTGRGTGVIYLIHFDQPIGDLHNPRGSPATTPAGRLTCPRGWSTTRPAAAPGCCSSSASRGSAGSSPASGPAPGPGSAASSSVAPPAAARSAAWPPSAFNPHDQSTRSPWSSASASPASPPSSRRSSCRRQWPHDPPTHTRQPVRRDAHPPEPTVPGVPGRSPDDDD